MLSERAVRSEFAIRFTGLIEFDKTSLMSVLFKNGYAEGFAFAVPEAFADALKQVDKIKPERFKTGDVFYQSADGYELEWGKYLKKGEKIIQVVGYKKSDLIIKIYKANKNQYQLEENETRVVTPEKLLKILKAGL